MPSARVKIPIKQLTVTLPAMVVESMKRSALSVDMSVDEYVAALVEHTWVVQKGES